MIRVHELSKSFGGQPVLRKVSLEVPKGEVAAVIGPSGGGKSTLLRCIIGLEPFEAGQVEFGTATLVAGMNERERSRVRQKLCGKIGMVFQQFHLFPHLTVLENVIAAPLYVGKLHRDEAIAKAERFLDRVGVLDKANSRPDSLSGGEQQRVAIARALAMDPEIILFDEPTSALDPFMTDEVLAVMLSLKEAGQSMLVVTHEMDFARRVADQIYACSRGEILKSDLVGRFFESSDRSRV